MIALRQVPGNIVATLVFFVLGETGFVRKESSFAVAWIVGVLVVGAVILGTPQKAVAGACDQWVLEPCETHSECIPHCKGLSVLCDAFCLEYTGGTLRCWCPYQ